MNSIIAIKDLRDNLSDFADLAEAGRTFTVFRRSKPSFMISPVEQKEIKKTYHISDLAGTVKTGNLAQNIDKDLYE